MKQNLLLFFEFSFYNFFFFFSFLTTHTPHFFFNNPTNIKLSSAIALAFYVNDDKKKATYTQNGLRLICIKHKYIKTAA